MMQELRLNLNVLRRQTQHRLVAYILNATVIVLWIVVLIIGVGTTHQNLLGWSVSLTLVVPTIVWWQWSGWSLILWRGYLDALVIWLMILGFGDFVEWNFRSLVLPSVWFPALLLALVLLAPLVCWCLSYRTLQKRRPSEDSGGWVEVWLVAVKDNAMKFLRWTHSNARS